MLQAQKKVTRSQYNALLSGDTETFYCSENWRQGDLVKLREFDFRRQTFTGSELIVQVAEVELKPIFKLKVADVIL